MLINEMFALADGTCVLINEMFALVDGTCVRVVHENRKSTNRQWRPIIKFNLLESVLHHF